MDDYDSKLGLINSSDKMLEILKNKFDEKFVFVEKIEDLSLVDLSKYSYLLIDLTVDIPNKLLLMECIKKATCKIIVISPHKIEREKFNELNELLQNLMIENQNLGVILVPEILGENIDFNKNFISHNLIMQSLLTDRLKVNDIHEKIYIISQNKLVDEIVRQTFSFGISGKKMLAYGFNKTIKYFVLNILKINESNIIASDEGSNLVTFKPEIIKENIFSIIKLVKNAKEAFKSANIVEPEDKILNPINVEVIKEKKNNFKFIKRIFLIIIFITSVYLTPLVMIFISGLMLYSAYKFSNTDQKLTTTLTNYSYKLSNAVNTFNFGNSSYTEFSNLINRIIEIARQLNEISIIGTKTAGMIMGNSADNLQENFDLLSANLDKIYIDLSFLQSDIDEINGITGNYIRDIMNSKRIDIASLKLKIYNLKKLTSRLSSLLGMDGPRKYMIIFQNNMELRPTGGFIGSFAFLTFDKGRLIEIVVNDVYSADGQLKGHVDPPEPIRRYLSEGGWYLRDANWDPDFQMSAQKIEWFLDKEIDQKVDGVIAIDLTFIQNLLKITGPINLTDFGKVIDHNNLYLTTQSEVEEEFFPGSIKKASFLTALSRNLIEELKNLNNDNYLSFIKAIYKNLEERHIQVYLHDNNSYEAIKNMGYAGKFVFNTDCGPRCIRDVYSINDANLGVNKSNYFITRSFDLNVNVGREEVKHELITTYNNQAGFSSGASGIYKTFTRLIIPKNTNFSGVRLYESDGSYKDLEFIEEGQADYKTVGVWFEIKPLTSAKLQFVWDLPANSLSEGGEYFLNVVKQAGTDADKLLVNVETSGLTLTGKAVSVYNTELSEDFRQRIFLK